eukprot:GILJ01004422.1.p1 GENE.GILJ01004422.1~~GILJ01004422.1.p1  ORF type:complete len:158 (-),score=21.90 GILJ01004422.1:100-573(-)
MARGRGKQKRTKDEEEEDDGSNTGMPPNKKARAGKDEDKEPVWNEESFSFKKPAHTKAKVAASGRGKRSWKNLKQIILSENYSALPPDTPTYVSLEAPPPSAPPKRYCDITGFEAKYTEPTTRLRYASASLYPFIRSLPQSSVDGYLSIRNAVVTLK